MTPPPCSLGIYALPPNTHNGEEIEIDGQNYVVTTVVLKVRRSPRCEGWVGWGWGRGGGSLGNHPGRGGSRLLGAGGGRGAGQQEPPTAQHCHPQCACGAVAVSLPKTATHPALAEQHTQLPSRDPVPPC